MGAEGIEPPAVGLEPTVLPLNYAPIKQLKEIFVFKIVYLNFKII